MNVEELLDMLEETLEEGTAVPFAAAKRVVDVDRCRDIVDEVRNNLPDELRDSKKIVADREQILKNAQTDADNIIKQAEERARVLVSDKEITKRAQKMAVELVNAAQAQELEPGLGQDIAWLHALHFPDGESINPRLWAQHLRLQAQELGVAFHTGMDITRIHYNPVGVEVNGQLHPFEHVVICTGAQRSMLTACGIALPLMSIWGYSVTAPVRDPLHAPRSAIMDWEQQATICRMGQRVRITAGLEMGSTPEAAHHQPTLQRMYHLLNDWFPGGVQLASAQTQIWRGARGYLPDGLPAVGASQHPGIWLNVAHGSHGISLAAGCARALADMLAGHDAAVDMQAFSPLRF